MRRSDREITDRAAIDRIIRGCTVCHLGLAVEGEPYVVPVSFGYDGASVFFHTARTGRKIDMIAANPRVCVQFERKVELVTDDAEACAWTFSFESAIGFGTIVELVDPAGKTEGLNRVMRHYSDRDWEFEEPALGTTRVWRADLETVTGKRSERKE
jgi:nitroimidazol reductase NimA-like FMN-containing flavoprotein (pyridoxamine 5'-phosphate oxidase superfamily)